MLILEEQLAKLPLDDFSKLVLQGALRVVADAENPIRLNLFAAAIGELYGHTLDRLAPDAEVEACVWFEFEKDQSKPTRRQRAKYATQGGLPDRFIKEAGVDVKHVHDDATAAITKLNKYTQVRPGRVVSEQTEIDTFVSEALEALTGLFESFDMCRDRIQSAIFDHVNQQTFSWLLSETILNLDEIAHHHSIEEICVNNIEVTSITHEAVNFVVSGTIEVGLHWRSTSDVRRGDGVLVDQNFSFRATLWSPVDDITSFEDVDYSVDISSWGHGYYDKDAVRA